MNAPYPKHLALNTADSEASISIIHTNNFGFMFFAFLHASNIISCFLFVVFVGTINTITSKCFHITFLSIPTLQCIKSNAACDGNGLSPIAIITNFFLFGNCSICCFLLPVSKSSDVIPYVVPFWFTNLSYNILLEYLSCNSLLNIAIPVIDGGDIVVC
eukprot:749749_1